MKIASLVFFVLCVVAPAITSGQEKQSVKSKVLMTCLSLCCGNSQTAQTRAKELWHIVEDGNTQSLDDFILENHGKPVDAQYQRGPKSLSLFNWAISRGSIKALHFLIDGGASLITSDGQYPLVEAIRNSLPAKRHEMMRLLLAKANANPLKVNTSGITALSYAQTIKDVAACKILMEALIKRKNKAQYMVTRTLSAGSFMPVEIAHSIAQFAFPTL
ncbi:hypothetical protein Noda2021_08570 [Candidatus Dependentiae bacterium Noda2021]|nr:hypothetical protein Noda2021_08570 [Candidatus Dependentiae bacterium Noda2021]